MWRFTRGYSEKDILGDRQISLFGGSFPIAMERTSWSLGELECPDPFPMCARVQAIVKHGISCEVQFISSSDKWIHHENYKGNVGIAMS